MSDSGSNSNPALEFAAVAVLAFFLCFDFIMGTLMRFFGYCLLAVGVLFGLAATVGILHRVLRGIVHIMHQQEYAERLGLLTGDENDQEENND